LGKSNLFREKIQIEITNPANAADFGLMGNCLNINTIQAEKRGFCRCFILAKNALTIVRQILINISRGRGNPALASGWSGFF